MSRLSDEWCCMNCVHQEECLENDPNMDLLGYCIRYEDVEGLKRKEFIWDIGVQDVGRILALDIAINKRFECKIRPSP